MPPKRRILQGRKVSLLRKRRDFLLGNLVSSTHHSPCKPSDRYPNLFTVDNPIYSRIWARFIPGRDPNSAPHIAAEN